MAVTLEEAREMIAVERRRCVREREAFRSFRSVIVSTSPAVHGRTESHDVSSGGPTVSSQSAQSPQSAQAAQSPQATQSPQAVPTRTVSQSDAGVERVKRAYRETVMAVDHYEEEYDDTLVESVEDELGSDVRVLFTGGTLTPMVKQTLLGRVDVALEARESFVEVLNEEADSVSDVAARLDRQRSRLASLDDRPLRTRGFDDLRRLWGDLRDVRRHLDDLAADRQRTLQHRTTVADVDAATYLFDGYPALDATATLAATVERAQRRVERCLTTRV